MTQPPTTPGPDDRADGPPPRPSAPPGPPEGQGPPIVPPPPGAVPPPGGFGPPGSFAPPGGFGGPPPSAAPVGYDPSQSYVVYQAVSGFGYGVPGPAAHEPMISPDYAGWWQRSIAIFKAAWRPLAILQGLGFLVTLGVVIPEAIWALKVSVEVLQAAEQGDAQPSLTPLLAPFALTLAAAAATGLVGSLVTAASNQIAVTVAAGQPPRLGPAFALAVRRFLPLWGWQLCASLVMLVGFCLCVLPGIYVYAVFVILPAVVTFERGGSAVSRCFQLVHRDFGSAIARIATIVGLTVLVGIVAYFVSQIIELAIGGPPDALAPQPGRGVEFTSTVITALVVSRIASALLTAAAKTFTDVLTVTAYADLRARAEPLSTAVLASEAGVPAAS